MVQCRKKFQNRIFTLHQWANKRLMANLCESRGCKDTNKPFSIKRKFSTQWDQDHFVLEFLGTSSSISTEKRNVSSLALHIPGASFLFDCGEGTSRQISKSSFSIGDLNAVFITHLHSDHIFGLPGVAVAFTPQEGNALKERKGALSLPLFAPSGLGDIFHLHTALRNYSYHPILPAKHSSKGGILDKFRNAANLQPESADKININGELKIPFNRQNVVACEFPSKLTKSYALNLCTKDSRIKAKMKSECKFEHETISDIANTLQNDSNQPSMAAKVNLMQTNSSSTLQSHFKSKHNLQFNGDGRLVAWDLESKCYLLLENDYVFIRAVPIRHSVFCLGYVIEEKVSRGAFKVDYLKSLGIEPGPAYRQLQDAGYLTLSDGRLVTLEDACGPCRRGRKIVILGDTCDPSAIAPLAMDADVLVHEATVANVEEASAVRQGHSSARMAGAFARRIRARNLILNHFSPRLDDRTLEGAEDDVCQSPLQLVLRGRSLFDSSIKKVVEQAKEAFGTDRVWAAKDLMRFHIPRAEVAADACGSAYQNVLYPPLKVITV